jgi:hypothetical protein
MKRPDEDKFLNDLLSGERFEALREATLAQGLGALRRRRRLQAAQRCILVCLPIVAAVIVVLKIASPPGRVASNAPAAPPPTAANPDNKVKIINDDELFALFPNRPMALVGKPGHQQLVFLDRPEPAPTGIRQ